MSFGNQMSIRTILNDECEGWLVFDTTFENSAVGGLRIADDITMEEVAALAREMTLKYSFIGLPRGGAKAGLRMPSSASPEQKSQLLAEFGRRIGPLVRKGLWHPWMDLNCSAKDLEAFFSGVGWGRAPTTDSALFTAISAREAIEACRDSGAIQAKRIRVAVEGFGNVATWLARKLPAEHYVIVAISTSKGAIIRSDGFSADELARKKKIYGDDLVYHLEGDVANLDDLFAADVDILVPAARTWSISDRICQRIRASFIVPAANAPYGTGVVANLESRGIVCLPGFVVNCGGVYGSTLSDLGIDTINVEKLFKDYYRPIIKALLDASAGEGLWATSLAERIARDRLANRQDPAESHSPYALIAKKAAQEKLLPRYLKKTLSLREFINNMLDLERLISQIRQDKNLSEKRGN